MTKPLSSILPLLFLAACVSAACAQGTAFTYQGKLEEAGQPAEGLYDLRFTLYSAESGGSAVGTSEMVDGLTVSDGLFTVTLDFGAGAFTGAGRWLALAVRPGASTGAYTALSPRQPITAAPYAIKAASVDGAAITGTISPSRIGAGTFTGTFSGDGAGLSNVPGTLPWQTVAGTTQTAAPNRSYLLTNAENSTLTLPATAAVGDMVMVSGTGSGGWQVMPGSGQSIVGYRESGVTWIPRETNRRWYGVASSADGRKVAAVADGGQIYTSVDGGVTWTPRESNRLWRSVASSADGSKLVAVETGGQIYTSTNGGVSWTARASNRNWASVASSADGIKLAAVADHDRIYTSADSGATWTPRESSFQWRSVASSADGNKLVAGVANGYLYTSNDAGMNWTIRADYRQWTGVASSADGNKLAAVDFGGRIYTSTDAGVNWVPRANNQYWTSVTSSADGNRLAAVGRQGQIHTSTDSGVTWTPRESNREWYAVGSSADGSSLIAAVNDGRIYTSRPADQPLTGLPGTTARLQFLDNGLWQPLAETHLAPNVVGNAEVSHLDASRITSGVFASFQIPPLDANKISSGTFADNRIPFLSASKIIAGTFSPDRIPDLDAGKISTGTLEDARLSSNVALRSGGNTFNDDQSITGKLGFGAQTRQMLNLWGSQYGIGVQDYTQYFRTGGDPNDGFAWFQGGTHSNTSRNPGPGGTLLMSLDRSYLALRGAGNEQPYIGGDGNGNDIEIGSRNAAVLNVGFWNSAAGSHMNVFALTFNPTSDRAAKRDFKPADCSAILEKVAALPITEWAFKGEASSRHLGPMAQDFKEAFGLGSSDKSIATVDADGVALAAIQGLHRQLGETRAELKRKESEIADLKHRLDRLEQLFLEKPKSQLDPDKQP